MVDGRRILHQIWHTPGGTVEERLRITDDWRSGGPTAGPVCFGDDFAPAAIWSFPLKGGADLAVLPYLFPAEQARDTEAMVRQHREQRALADEFAVPLLAYHPAGMDWLLWLFPPEEIILRAVEDPSFVQALLEPINRAYTRRLEILLELGVDAVCRRGWYESTDFWTRHSSASLPVPALTAEMQRCRAAGVPYIYQMDSGVHPLLRGAGRARFLLPARGRSGHPTGRAWRSCAPRCRAKRCGAASADRCTSGKAPRHRSSRPLTRPSPPADAVASSWAPASASAPPGPGRISRRWSGPGGGTDD